MFQTVNQSFIDKIVEELHFFRCIFHDIADHIFQHGLCKDHVIFQISECDLRLDHPEFCCMTCCVGVLCTESRSECINVAECLCKGFAIELSTYGQVGLFSEEILAEIYAALLCFRDVVQIHGCYLKHFARTFAVTSGDQRSMHINEISLLEEFVDRISGQRTNSEYCLEGISSRTEMCDTSQIFKAVTFFLKWVIRCGSSFYHNFVCLDLKWLFCFRCRDQRTGNDNGCSYIQFGNLCKVFHFIVVYDLQCLKESTVMQH